MGAGDSLEPPIIRCAIGGSCGREAYKMCDIQYPMFRGCRRLMCQAHFDRSGKYREYGNVCTECRPLIHKQSKRFVLMTIGFWLFCGLFLLMKYALGVF